ncbi:hypothetical protein HN51_018936 [Arachis hypogaea]|uniref:ADP-ribosyl cyclase/cyclic ADP-ribose hydrolase n=2 Tax=Arachis TaxID=3817 RepID=A0A445BV05_ARAHY|nr:disease resistance protein TAO1 [Arachis hypogaea]XP_029144226.1 disease resistance protein TAO1 [Arachis hypogaea]QHO30585.1 Disease resistance protein [Arachis hypogaea]RYR42543.1 hypothetical protein Ahy_A08g039012 isoform A [Arachis hypogaea]
MASSPSITYDVFLSFRGTDTRRGILSHLVKAFNQKQIETYVDYMLREGTEISHSLLTAIEQSQISLIIFSQDYASSRWCLDELVTIMKCRKQNGQIAIPVFYEVDPSWVRHQKGSYQDAFANHEKTSSQDKVQIWRQALNQAANLSGLHSSNFGNDAEFIEEIVKRVLQRLNQAYQCDPKEFVGIHEPIAELESVLCRESKAVLVVGLWGMGGIGKTTLASNIFNRLQYEFQGVCFLENVRERVQRYGMTHLKKELLSKLLEEKDVVPFIMPDGITNFAKRRLSRKAILLVLDDVNDPDQLEDLCGRGFEWFGPTTRIIVTTRDKHVLLVKQVDHIHEVKPLNDDESLKLFNLNAFKQNYDIERDQDHAELAMKLVTYANGIPLALKVLGSSLYGRSKEEWESQLSKLEKIPHVKIQNILRVSYNDLDRHDQNIFLYIACFFETDNAEQIKCLLDSCGYSTAIGLRNLHDKALISIAPKSMAMHDLIRDMGREVVREESPSNPGNRSRLWDPVDIYEVLKYNRGTETVESITFDMKNIDMYLSLHPRAFARMYKLKFLRISCSWTRHGECLLRVPQGIESLSDELRLLEWNACPLKSLPSSFCAENLVKLMMMDSGLEKLWDGVQNIVNLKEVYLQGSRKLMELPDLSRALKLQVLNISECVSLRQVPSSIASCHNLLELNLSRCYELGSFHHCIYLESLKILFLDSCINLREFSLLLSTDSDTLPAKATAAMALENISLVDCCNLSLLPHNIGMLSSLKYLSLCRSYITCLPESIKHLSLLKSLNLRGCQMLQSLPELPSSITELDVIDCTSLETTTPSTFAYSDEQIETEIFAFANCIKLDHLTKKGIMEDACMRIKRAANTCLAAIKENEDDDRRALLVNPHYHYKVQGCLRENEIENEDGREYQYHHRVQFCLPGKQVPSWFTHRSRNKETMMTIELVLPHRASNDRFLGFILCVVVPKKGSSGILGCKYCIESVEYSSWWNPSPRVGVIDNVFLWYVGECCIDIVREMKENVCKLKVSFQFSIGGKIWTRDISQCGVHPIYASNVFKQGVVVTHMDDDNKNECDIEEQEQLP